MSSAERNRRYIRRRREAIAAYKLERGCADCGYRAHPAALEFDHPPTKLKLFNIAAGLRHPWAEILEEMEKCDVVCANCHRIRTHSRKT